MSKQAECEATGSARDFVPRSRSLAVLRNAAAGCRGCELYCHATQTVFGEGPREARMMLVGEQPGDQEDLAGKPFVGPSGQLLDACLKEAGIDRGICYVTNAVKHFKWTPRGKRRLHSKPSAREVAACRPWLQAEIAAIGPEVIVCLGATAAQSLLGGVFRLTKHRGEFQDSEFANGAAVLATVHPSSLLRIPDHEGREAGRRDFIADLKVAGKRLKR